jgi:hypothetical protein
VIILAALLLVLAAQGAVVFATAYVGLRIFKVRHPARKFIAMLLSWAAWTFITLVGYAATDGSFGLFDGFGFVLILCATAMTSSVGFLLAWTLWPVRAARVAAN